jgi:CelD/BcsL family acetyltransferase involved in cellulose biosynthesis
VPEVTITTTAREMAGLRPLWESLRANGRFTVFQDFHWNLLAFTMFGAREQPCVVCARASYGTAIVPAVMRHSDASLRLLGEELFDYRTFLCDGESSVLACALAALAGLKRRLEVVAIREPDCTKICDGLQLLPFSAAPAVRCADCSAEAFAAAHGRLARNLRRLARLGFDVKTHRGTNAPLLRSIYERKAAQDPDSLFRDPLRIKFLVNAGLFHPGVFEIFTLECGSRMAAALVTLRDRDVRRMYTAWFDPELKKFSPGLTLIYEVTRRALAVGMDCDYMTGEQPYKLRLATTFVPLYRLRATAQQLAALAGLHQPSSALISR